MPNNNRTIYTIPGWGFKSTIFSSLLDPEFNFIGLDYYQLSDQSIQMLTTNRAAQITQPSIIIGWSFGGLIAIQLAALFPEKIKQLILISSQPKMSAAINWHGISDQQQKSFTDSFLKHPKKHMQYFSQLTRHPNQSRVHREYLNQHLIDSAQYLPQLTQQLHMLFNTDLRTSYQDLNQPILQILNEHDAIIQQRQEQLIKLNTNIKITAIANCSHAGFLTHKDMYKQIIKDFIQS